MNVLILATSYFPVVGGLEQVVHHVSRELGRRGHTAIIVTERTTRKYKAHEMCDGIAVYRIPYTPPGLGRRETLLFPAAALYSVGTLLTLVHRHRINLIHLQGVSRNGFWAIALHRLCRLPMIATVQGIEVEGVLSGNLTAEVARWQRLVLHQVAQEATLMTACSHYLGQRLLEIVPDIESKLIPVHNAIDPAEFTPPGKTAQPLPLPHTRRYLLGVGRMVAKKGFDILLRAFAHLINRADHSYDGDLVLVGDGPEQNHLQQIAQELGIAQRVCWKGAITNRQALLHLYRSCDVFVVPSRQEPFGIVCLEALAAQKPLVASAVGGIPEIIRDGMDGLLVPVDDAVAMANAIDCIITERHAVASPQERARHAASFSWQATTGHYLALYERVLQECSGAAA